MEAVPKEKEEVAGHKYCRKSTVPFLNNLTAHDVYNGIVEVERLSRRQTETNSEATSQRRSPIPPIPVESFTDKIPDDSPIKRKQDNSEEDQHGGGFINEQLFKPCGTVCCIPYVKMEEVPIKWDTKKSILEGIKARRLSSH